mgnify:CR=1 FL=1
MAGFARDHLKLETQALLGGVRVRRLVNIKHPARRKLEYLFVTVVVEDLCVALGNSLEALEVNRAGQQR